MPDVFFQKTKNTLKTDLKDLLSQVGGLKQFIKPGDRVLIKPNFNTADPFPASTDLDFLRAVVELIQAENPKEIIIGEACTFSQSTQKVMTLKQVSKLAKLAHVRIIDFDQARDWVTKEIPQGKYLKKVTLPKILFEVDKLILLPCCKTHSFAAYTGALKLSIGFMSKMDKMMFHTGHLQEKIAELNLLIHPDLVIMDARKCFITKGPASGEVREPQLLLASTSRIQIDQEGMKIISQFEGNDLCNISSDDLVQIKYARELGIK